MADIISDGFTRVYWVTSISNIAAPTTSELNAGIRLDSTMTDDGLIGFEPDTADVGTSKFSSVFDTNTAGRIAYAGNALRFCKQDGTDTIYNTLAYRTVGYVVIRRSLDAATAWASTQKVEVYPAVCGQRKKLAYERNTLERWESPMKINATPNPDAVVA